MQSSISKVIALTEYGAPVSFDDANGVMFAALQRQSSLLKAKLRLEAQPFFVERGDGKTLVRANGVTGSMKIAGRGFDIAPRFAASAETWPENLLNILFRAFPRGEQALSPGSLGSIAPQSFIDHVAASFAYYLQRAYASGMVRLYRSEEGTGRAVRGRLKLGPKEIVDLVRRPGVVSFDDNLFDANNSINEMLLWAGERLSRAAVERSVRVTVQRSIAPLKDVVSTSVRRRLGRNSLPRQYADYAVPLEIANHLARAQASTTAVEGLDAFNFIVDTHRLFERFVERSVGIVVQAKGMRSERQASVPYGRAQGKGYGDLYTRPDVRVTNPTGGVELIVDAKYKYPKATTLRAGTSSDFYQLLAAMIANKVHNGLLVFPRIGDGWGLRCWVVEIGRSRYRMFAGTIDIGAFLGATGRAMVDLQLGQMLSDVLSASA